jgi:hypothetical protein
VYAFYLILGVTTAETASLLAFKLVVRAQEGLRKMAVVREQIPARAGAVADNPLFHTTVN